MLPPLPVPVERGEPMNGPEKDRRPWSPADRDDSDASDHHHHRLHRHMVEEESREKDRSDPQLDAKRWSPHQ